MATLGSATALGLGDLVGSLEVGKRADIITVDLRQPHAWPVWVRDGGNVAEHLVWSCSGADVRTTIVDGAVLMVEGRLLTLDLAEVEEEAGREATHLLTKAGVLDHIFARKGRPA